MSSPVEPAGNQFCGQNAKNVIISGSALNTPKVLELSGIGDPQVLEKWVIFPA
jgi:choline dehydrogenase-like flavoprotein